MRKHRTILKVKVNLSELIEEDCSESKIQFPLHQASYIKLIRTKLFRQDLSLQNSIRQNQGDYQFPGIQKFIQDHNQTPKFYGKIK